MTQPEPDGIPYDAQQVMDRAYARVGQLTQQLDQLVSAYEAQALEMARLRDRLADRAPVATDA